GPARHLVSLLQARPRGVAPGSRSGPGPGAGRAAVHPAAAQAAARAGAAAAYGTDPALRAARRAARALRRAADALPGLAADADPARGDAEVEDARAGGAAAPAPGGLPRGTGQPQVEGDAVGEVRRAAAAACRGARRGPQGPRLLAVHQSARAPARAPGRRQGRLRIPRRQDAR